MLVSNVQQSLSGGLSETISKNEHDSELLRVLYTRVVIFDARVERNTICKDFYIFWFVKSLFTALGRIVILAQLFFSLRKHF